MGLIKAATGAVGGTLADQWKDFLTVPRGIPPTAALFPAARTGTNAARGSNTKSSDAVVTNGSKIVVPEGYGLLLFQDGKLTAFASEPGGYVWDSEDVNSQSVFAGDEIAISLVAQSWERFKFGGRPGVQQLALFVRLGELPNNKFGTQSEIYWDDAYLNTQVGAIAHGTYSVTIVDPITFASEYVPAAYLQGQQIFDFTDRSNPAASQLFSEVVGSLASAFSLYANDPARANRMARIQQDSMGFTEALAEAVERSYQWQATRGIAISKVTIMGIRYDESTAELLRTVQRADALAGSRGNANLQASTAAGIEAAGEQGGSGGILGIGIAAGSVGLSKMMQDPSEGEAGADEDDLLVTLERLKRALDAGLIQQADYEAAKAKALGLS
jgi:membrane protease subunit (stomatin/prohibitin family)